MRCLLCAVVLLSSALLVRAADEPKPNTLTPKEIADGWLLLFDGESTFGWKTEGDVKVAGGVLTLGGSKQARVYTTTEFGDAFDLSCECHAEGKELAALLIRFNSSDEMKLELPQPEVGRPG